MKFNNETLTLVNSFVAVCSSFHGNLGKVVDADF